MTCSQMQSNPCESCIHKWECWDQRGYCNQYKSKEEVIKQIEALNNANQTAPAEGAISANEGGREPSLLRQPCGDSDILREELA